MPAALWLHQQIFSVNCGSFLLFSGSLVLFSVPKMLPQAADFLLESESLYHLIAPLSDQQLEESTTAFKGWTVSQIIAHLLVWNDAAGLTLRAPDEFSKWLQNCTKVIAELGDIKASKHQRLGNSGADSWLKSGELDLDSWQLSMVRRSRVRWPDRT